MQFNITSANYRPASPLTGSELSVYRGRNVKLTGAQGALYFRTYQGSENLNEVIPHGTLTGTIAFSPANNLVTGTGTNFQGELHLGSMLQASNGEVLVVIQIVSATQFRTGRLPFTTQTIATATIAPVIFPLDINRGTLLHGNAAIFDKGTILCAGAGVLRINGSVLPGDSLTATRRLQVALYDSTANTYDVQDVGFDDVPNISNGDIAVVASGGTKNMNPGYYSFKVAYYSTITTGWGNPTATLLAADIDGYHVTAANSTFDFDFSGDTPPAKADGYIIYGSAFAGSSDISRVNAIQGGWFQIGDPIPFSSLTAGHWVFDYTDFDLTITVSFDNDPPPDCEYITTLDRYPVAVSCNGRGVNITDREAETSPGPFVSPIKAENFDAYPNPYKVPTEKGETIIGEVSAAGRFFVLTPNTLQAVTPTGLPTAPFTCRPFWRRGFQNPYNLCFVDDTLYGFTTAGMYRSIAQGDEGSESNTFAADVESQTKDWAGAFEFTEHDGKNEEICFIYSASRQNENGWWESDILPWNLKQQAWATPVILSDPDRDMVVSGVAAVGGHLVFIAGGRRDGTTDQWDTWQYDSSDNNGVDAYFAFSYQDNGVETTPKIVRNPRPKGLFTNGKIKYYAAFPDSDINIADLEAGVNPVFEIDLDDSTSVKTYKIFKRKMKNALMWTARVEMLTEGVANQFHELSQDVEICGQQR